MRHTHLSSIVLGVALGAGATTFFAASHPAALAKEKDEKSSTNADYARDAREHLKKAHEDVDHLVNAASDKKEKNYPDAEEAKKAIDRADKALGRYLGIADEAPAKK